MATESARTPALSYALPQYEQVFSPPSLLQRPWVQNILPWVSSLTIHAGIFAMAAAMVVVVVHTTPPPLRQEQVMIPEAVAMVRDPGGVPNIGNTDEMNRQLTMMDPDSGGQRSGASMGPAIDPSSGALDAIARNLPSTAGGGGGTSLKSFGIGAYGDGQGHALVNVGPPGGGAAGPRGAVFGCGGNARHIVFVCDASGSMTNKFASLKEQLRRAIEKLRVPQTFDIVFFQSGKATVFTSDRLKQETLALANSDNKRQASAFLEEVTSTSTSDPMPALSVAFARHPDLIYLLTDGDFPDNEAVYKQAKELNKPDASGRRAKINTIAFVDDSDRDIEFKKTLQKIADDSDGVFREIKENELDENP